MRETLELSTGYAPPVGELEERMVRAWARAFDIDRVGAEDDFFELGGDSLVAEDLAISLNTEFDVQLKRSQFFSSNTPRKLARIVELTIDSSGSDIGVAGANTAGARPPLFMIHGAAGLTFLRSSFLAELHPEQPIYAFEAPGYNESSKPLRTVREIANHYLSTMLKVSTKGPWNIAAMCDGSYVALEILQLMNERGIRPDHVVLLDPSLPKQLRREYRRTRYGRMGAAGNAANQMVESAFDIADALHMFVSTGAFIGERDPRAVDDRRVMDFLIRKRIRAIGRDGLFRSLLRRIRNGVLAAEVDDGMANFNKRQVALARTEKGARTKILLRHAFRECRCKVTDYPAVLVVRGRVARRMDDPAYPLNRLIPNRVYTISGEKHYETVSSKRTARFLQLVISGVDVKEAEMMAETMPPPLRQPKPTP